ncbi:O-antigen ligase family protein, partial [Marinobacter antarcticus]
YGGALFFRSRLDFFYKMIFLSAFISSVVVVLSVSTLGMGGWGRATIPVFFEGKFSYFPTGYESSSDPNVLSYFLYLGALAAIYCRSINSTGKVFVALLVFAGMLTLSRSGFLAFVVAVISFQLVNLTYNLCSDKSIKVSINWMLSVVILGGVAFAIAPYFYDLGGMWDTLAERALDQASNADRFSRLKNTMEVVLDRPANFFFGHGMGFASETSDPHLLYLSTVMDTGLFSLIVFILALVIPACQCLCYTKSIRLKAFIVSLLVFFLTISLFYWQVRTYYFFMFLILTIYFHMAANQRVSSFNTRTSAGVGSEK